METAFKMDWIELEGVDEDGMEGEAEGGMVRTG